MPLANVTLDDKYTAESGRVFMTGMQALVRLPMLQRQRVHDCHAWTLPMLLQHCAQSPSFKSEMNFTVQVRGTLPSSQPIYTSQVLIGNHLQVY